MAEKGFGVKEVNLIGASGTPTITSPNNLNLNAVNVAISTNASIGGNLTVSGTVGIAGTLTYEDVTNIDSVGIITARSGVNLTGGNITLGDSGGASDDRLVLGASSDLQIFHAGGENFIRGVNSASRLYIDCCENLNVRHLDTNGLNAETMIKAIGDGAVELYHNNSKKFETSSSGATVTGTLAATAVTGDGSGLTGIAVTEAPVTDYTITSNSSSAYRFHGGGVDETADDPDLYLIRGQKYRFNNTTGSSHPFALRVSSGGSAYTDGVTGSQNGIQFFTVPYSAPASLVYQCTVHSGMVGNIYIRGGSSTANISNNADNRIITGGSGGDLNAESTFTYNGTHIAKIDTDQTYAMFQLDGNSGGSIEFYENGTRRFELYGVDAEVALYDRDKGAYHTRFKSGGNVEISDGKLLIGTTTEGHADADDLTIATSGNTGITIRSGTTSSGGIYFSDATSGNAEFDGFIVYNQSSRNLLFGTQQSTRMRIDSSGRVKIGNDFSATAEADDLIVGSLTGGHGISVFSQNNEGGFICFGDTDTSGVDSRRGVIRYQHSDDSFRFGLAGNNEKLRITSDGYVHLGNTGHGTNKVGGQAITGQDFDPIFKIYNSTASKWLMHLRNDNSTAPNGIFMRAGNASTNYTLYLTGGDENNPHLIVRGDGKVGINSTSPFQTLDVKGSINGGTVNQPFLRFHDSHGNQRSTKHYFKCVKGSTSIFDILTVDLNTNFHQALIILYYGARIQNGWDSTTFPVHKIIGVNRFNGGNIGFTKNTVVQDSTVSTHANIDVVATSSTQYRIRLTYSGTAGGSSFCCGSVEIIGVGSGTDGAFYSLAHSHGLVA